MFSRMSIFLATFTFSMVAQATLIDFTDQSWKDAIGSGKTSATVGNVTLTSTSGYLNFNGNSSERTGCQAGQPDNGLACLGDGIGISDDEITQRTSESITISFANSVNVDNIFLLDLFGTEGTGETAVIDGNLYHNALDNAAMGGFFATGYTAEGITSILLTGYKDCFSDYALASIEVSAVPLPGAAILFGSALLGFFGFKRRRHS